jgi:hypothetical protein
MTFFQIISEDHNKILKITAQKLNDLKIVCSTFVISIKTTLHHRTDIFHFVIGLVAKITALNLHEKSHDVITNFNVSRLM